MTAATKKLRISNSLVLSDDIVTKTIAILAQRRVGKTYSASVIAEEMVAAKIPFVALDPTGAWWGLRSSADGKKQGLPVVILGGQHGDVPLERGAGKFIADLVLDYPGWYVIDFSLFESGAAERQFATDFAERIYRRKGQPNMDFAMHLFVDECDRFIPQRVGGGRGENRETDQRMLGAFEAIVRRGGIRGLGTTLISQRAAVVNKNVLEQIDLLIALRVVGPNDRRAIEDYLKSDADDEQRKVMMGSLSSLALGEAWFWEPGGDPPLFDRVKIRERHTFNSSATPKAGQRRVEPSKFAEVDLAAVQSQMAEAIHRAEENDPKILKRRIVDLERELAKKPTEAARVETVTVTETVEVAYVPQEIVGEIVELGRLIEDLRRCYSALASHVPTFGETSIPAPLRAARRVAPTASAPAMSSTSRTAASAPRVAATPVMRPESSTGLKKAERLILSVLAQFPDGRTKRQLAMLSGYAIAGGFNNAIGSLRSLGFINKAGEPILILPEGLAAIEGNYEPLPSGRALLDFWLGKLNKAERLILSELIESWPTPLNKEDLAERTGYAIAGGFNNALGRLRTLELITRGAQILPNETLAQEVHGG
jgi:hypothetical protein